MHSVSDMTQNWASQREIAHVFLAETGSTNDDAKARVSHETEKLVLYSTSHQAKGRGRGANQWLDTGAGESLLSTWSLEAVSPPQAITGPRVGLAVFNAVRSVWPSLPWSLKAPNDLMLDGLKCAGLLVESISSGSRHRLLIGLGFNILNHPRKFTEATHLGSALDHSVTEGEWFQFLDALRSELEDAANECVSSQLTASACEELAQALNANPNRRLEVIKVSPTGDLLHAQGTLAWTEL